MRGNLPLRTSLGLSSPEVAFGLCFPASCLGLSQRFIKMLCHLPGLLRGFLPGCLLAAFPVSPMKDLHIGWELVTQRAWNQVWVELGEGPYTLQGGWEVCSGQQGQTGRKGSSVRG